MLVLFEVKVCIGLIVEIINTCTSQLYGVHSCQCQMLSSFSPSIVRSSLRWFCLKLKFVAWFVKAMNK